MSPPTDSHGPTDAITRTLRGPTGRRDPHGGFPYVNEFCVRVAQLAAHNLTHLEASPHHLPGHCRADMRGIFPWARPPAAEAMAFAASAWSAKFCGGGQLSWHRTRKDRDTMREKKTPSECNRALTSKILFNT